LSYEGKRKSRPQKPTLWRVSFAAAIFWRFLVSFAYIIAEFSILCNCKCDGYRRGICGKAKRRIILPRHYLKSLPQTKLLPQVYLNQV